MMQRSAPDQRFDDQLEAMVKAREDGLIAGIGLSEVSLEQLLHAARHTEIVCVQNQFNLVDRSSQPVLDECTARGIAFVPFFPLGSGFAADNPVLGNEQLRAVAAELDRTPAQVALAWTLSVAPNVLLIPGTSSVAHLEENLAAGDIELSAAGPTKDLRERTLGGQGADLPAPTAPARCPAPRPRPAPRTPPARCWPAPGCGWPAAAPAGRRRCAPRPAARRWPR